MTPLIPVRLTCRFKNDGNGETRPLKMLCKVSQNILQYMVNMAWKYDVRTRGQLHRLVYKELRKLYPNVPAILIPTLYKKALGTVKSSKSNNGSKPVIKKPSAILHKEMYKLDLEKNTIEVLGFKYSIDAGKYAEKFKDGWSSKEVVVRFKRNSAWFNVVFEKLVELVKPKTVMGIDLNFKNLALTVLDFKGNVLYQEKVPFKGLTKALTHKVLQEKIKKKFNRSWRFIKNIRKAIRKHGFRQHSRCTAEIHLATNKIISIAERFQSYLSLENLKGLRANNELEEAHLWAYRKQQFVLDYKALLKGLKNLPVSAKGTSSKCPVCNRRLRQKTYEELVCSKHGLMDRDLLASWNIAKKGLGKLLRCGVFGSTLNAPEADANPRSNEGEVKERVATSLTEPIEVMML